MTEDLKEDGLSDLIKIALCSVVFGAGVLVGLSAYQAFGVEAAGAFGVFLIVVGCIMGMVQVIREFD